MVLDVSGLSDKDLRAELETRRAYRAEAYDLDHPEMMLKADFLVEEAREEMVCRGLR